MPRYFIEFSFNGTNYHGWQSQSNAITVQSALEKSLQTLLHEDIKTTGAGRTDTGVHARRYFAHFDSDHALLLNKKDFRYKMNAILPGDIAITDLLPVKSDSHARYSAISRTYTYYISRVKDPFDREFSWHYTVPLDINLMNDATVVLKNFSDFTSFSKLHSNTKNNNCIVYEAKWTEQGNQLIFCITANRFLRNMVRSIVGTMIEIGRGKIDHCAFISIIEGKNRTLAGFSAPARGLFLTDIRYVHDIFL